MVTGRECERGHGSGAHRGRGAQRRREGVRAHGGASRVGTKQEACWRDGLGGDLEILDERVRAAGALRLPPGVSSMGTGRRLGRQVGLDHPGLQCQRRAWGQGWRPEAGDR